MNSHPDYSTIHTPNLIQRGTFRKITEQEIVGLDSLISYDYMGSSEFEFGTLPHSLRRITKSWNEYVWFPIEEIKDADGQVLFVLCRKKQEAEVVSVVKLLAASDHGFRLKERCGLCEYIACKSEYDVRIDFWWDVTERRNSFGDDPGTGNDWMCCFGNNIRPLVMAIYKVCEKHEVPAIGPAVPLAKDAPMRSEIKIDNGDTRRDVLAIHYPDGNKTIILKRKIVQVNDANDTILKVQVLTKSGINKWIEIPIARSSTRSILFNMVKDWPEINKHLLRS
jgi:hypothetical protein